MMLTIPTPSGPVSALIDHPDNAKWIYVLGHGAGAGMRHAFLQRLSDDLGERGIATLRYQFPYMEARRNRPDSPAVAQNTVRAAVAMARDVARGLRIVAGGKSFGGRMTSQAQAADPLPSVEGLAFVGFPLHPPKRPSIGRAGHLDAVDVPMLFLQGTRDDLADLALMREVCTPLGTRATLHVVEGGDHGFKVLKRSGRTEDDVMTELADTILHFCDRL